MYIYIRMLEKRQLVCLPCRRRQDLGILKMAFIQKVLVNLSFPKTDEPYYFPELEF